MKVFNALIIFLIISISIGFGSAYDVEVDVTPKCKCGNKEEKIFVRLRLFKSGADHYIYSKWKETKCEKTVLLFLKDVSSSWRDFEAEIVHKNCYGYDNRMPIERQCEWLSARKWWTYYYKCDEKKAVMKFQK
uniref:NTR domain-containing protein n=1 Tax=Strongyloides papillosus TaxID=174720 RepID=A0A0N5C0Y2_STREA